MADFELRQAADGKTWNLSGYASKTGHAYRVNDPRRGSSFDETIMPGAWRSTLATPGLDVVLCTEHAPPYVARTPRTLTLTEDRTGLQVAAQLDSADPDVQSMVSKVKNGILPEMSFSFRVPSSAAETWSPDGGTRTIHALDMDNGDVSVVRNGANPSTEVSVRGAAAGTFEVRTAGGLIAVFDRQMGAAGYTAPEGADECPECGGDGWASDHVGTCKMCGGLGWVDPDEDDRAAGGNYAAHQMAQLGAKGMAFKNPDGHWSFPTATPGDVQRAIQAIGRAPEPVRAAVRRYIMARARKLGLSHLIPSSWASDGALRSSSPLTSAELRARAVSLISQATEMEAEALIRRERKRSGLAEVDSIAEFRRYAGMAAEARSRGDDAAAATYARIAEQEALAAASGL